MTQKKTPNLPVSAKFNVFHRTESTHLKPEKETAQWFAIYTRSRFEKKLYGALQKTGAFKAFLPLIKEKRAWSDRIKTVLVPLLPSYVFVKLPLKELHQIYYYPGFVHIVSFEGKPCAVREEEINLLEQIIANDLTAQKSNNCQVGDWVRITRGPLKGWEGRVDGKRGKSRIVFHFECIQQAISVEVKMEDVEKI